MNWLPPKFAAEHEGVEASRVEDAPDVPGRPDDHVEVVGEVLNDLDEQERQDRRPQRAGGRRRPGSPAGARSPRACRRPAPAIGAEDQPAEADHVEGRHDPHALPAGAVDRLGGSDALEPGLGEPVPDQQHALIDAPEHERPGRAVPEAADDHRQHQVAVERSRAAAAAAQRDVEVVAEPGREADVPAGPEVLRAGGEVGQVEVQGQLEAQALGDPPGRVGVAREVAVDLEREGVDRQQRQAAVDRLPLAEQVVDDVPPGCRRRRPSWSGPRRSGTTPGRTAGGRTGAATRPAAAASSAA